MNEFSTQLNVIQIAVNNLETRVKLPKDLSQRTHFTGAIEQIKAATAILRELIDRQSPEVGRLYKE